MKTNTNRLTQANFYRLAEYVKANSERYQKEQPSLVNVAKEAALAIKVNIVPEQVKKACKMTNVVWESKKQKEHRALPYSKQLQEMGDRIIFLETRLNHLYEKLGETPPNGVST